MVYKKTSVMAIATVKKSPLKTKKYTVKLEYTTPDGKAKVKNINFGAPKRRNYLETGDEKQRQAYLEKNANNNDPLTAKWWERNYAYGTKQEIYLDQNILVFD